MNLATPIAAMIICLMAVSPAHGFIVKPKNAAGTPRTETPADDATAHYERKSHKTPDSKTGHALTYFWRAPEAPYPEGVQFPMVLILHGSSGKAPVGQHILAPDIQLAHPAFLVMPVLAAGETWALPEYSATSPTRKDFPPLRPALQDVVHLIQTLAAQYPVDPRRIYVIGCSEGGYGSFAAARYYPDIFAAAVPVSGAWNPEDAQQMTKIPIWAFHGARDTIIPPDETRDLVSLIHAYGGPIYYSELPDMGHNCPSTRYYPPQMWSWLFSQTK